ncbi:hypothetical protein [Roseomonas sp. AR75]|jgi:hypothetical protein|uniref:hypothetical protein n=1 Tax=Roseomonas sp. AR75 TaxID=2562311 RepID=UPI0010BFCF01|nr:hypothetical protein [Roseomonas sp. AR75]
MRQPLTAGGPSEAAEIPLDLRIPAPPNFRWIPARSAAPWWRDAMRWSLIGLTASWAAGEVTLRLVLP